MKRKLAWLMGLVLVLSMAAACATGAAAAESGGVAGAEDMTAVEEVVREGMVPIYGDSLLDGEYEVAMDSSSSMFKADRCVLKVEDGTLAVTLYMISDSYPWMFADRAEAAAAADEADYIPLEEDEEGNLTFTLPIEALDAGVECAAFSRRKELWYDRTLVFRADSLPLEAFREGVFATPESLGLEDGTYTVEVTLEGGSGRASVTSPAQLTVEDGRAMAAIEWGSSNYDFMIVNGEEYLPVNTEGNSVFLIPVAAFDYSMAVQADTTAMSQPYLIDYTLRFSADSIEAAG